MSNWKLCRTCTKLVDRKGAKDIFKQTNQIMLQHIQEVTGIELKTCRDWPHLICKQCQADLTKAYDFIKRVVNAEAFFQTKQCRTYSAANIEDASAQKSPSITVNSGSPLSEIFQNIKYDSCNADYEDGKSEMQFDNDPIWESSFKEELQPEIKNPLSVLESCLEEMPAIEDDLQECVRKVPEVKEKLQRKKHKKRKKTEKEKSNSGIEIPPKSVEECGKKMPKVQANKQHKRKRKPPSQIIICELCGQHFTYPNLFVLHQKRHTGQLHFQCELCPSKFLTSHELKRHVRSHTGEKPFPCKYCGRCFVDYGARTKHERIHTNERPFACNQCDKTFARSNVLKNHMLVHTGERSFRCDLCNRSFQRKTHLDTHFRSTMHQQSVQDKQQKESVEINAKTF